MFDWMRIVADRMLRLDTAGRVDLMARLAGPVLRVAALRTAA